MSLRKACKVFGLRSSVYYYRQVFKSSDEQIRAELILLADSNQTWGFWMMHNRLKNLGFGWNHKRVYRIYKSMRLNLRSRRKKRLPARIKQPLVRPIYPNVIWILNHLVNRYGKPKKIRMDNGPEFVANIASV